MDVHVCAVSGESIVEVDTEEELNNLDKLLQIKKWI